MKMISSMTAFARGQIQLSFATIVCELRSINHRFLEMYMHLPEELRGSEMKFRDLLRQHLKRGKIDCAIRLHLLPGTNASHQVNLQLAKELCAHAESISGYLRNPAPIAGIDVLSFPGVIESKTIDREQIEADLLALLNKVIEDLKIARVREGSDLKNFCLQRVNQIEIELTKVKSRLPSLLPEQKEKITKRFTEIKLEFDPTRLEQELLLYTHRIDVAEEIERAETHLKEIARVFHLGGQAGRRLDFLLQELNREANTLGSKSVDAEVSRAVIEIKVAIEQLREQIQNIE